MGNLKDTKIRFNQSTEYNTALNTYETGHIYFTNNNNDINNNAIILEGKIYGAAPLIEIQYNQLKELVTNKKLIPGTNYKIIDYVTITSQAGTASAGHQFDIIVTAISENQLSENARACKHKDDNYFSHSNLSAWELKYCLDNDDKRFAWCNKKTIIDSTNVTIQESLVTENIFNTPFLPEYYIYIDATGNKVNEYTSTSLGPRESDYFIEWGRETTPDGCENQLCIYKNDLSNEDYIEGGAEEGTDYGDKFFYCGTEDVDGITYDKWKKSEVGYGWNITENNGNIFILTQRITIGEINLIENNNGKGVIYYMKDEYNNECPYDFKNIQFYNDRHDKYLFTFSWINENDEIEDLTLRQDLESNDGFVNGTYSNTIKPCYNDIHVQILNNIIFINNHSYESGHFYGCYNNIFGDNCYNNSFGNNCYNNRFGNNCNVNRFGNYCSNNSFGNNCNNNRFGNNCNVNRFGNYCSNNSFGHSCQNNILGNTCEWNNFGDSCDSNSFGNKCQKNNLKDSCQNNSFGIECINNFLGNNCEWNIFGNECDWNNFSDNCSKNYFINCCHNNSFGKYCNNNIFDTGCGINIFFNNCYYNRFGIECGNNHFGNNCSSNNFGINCVVNSFGNNCNGNVFNNNCSFNNLGNECDYNTFGNDCKHNGFYDGNDCAYDEDKRYYVCGDVLLNNVRYNKLGNGCSNLIIWNDLPTNDMSDPTIQNINISQGVKGIDIDGNNAVIPESIYISDWSPNYETKVAKNTNGDIKIYCEADLIY